MTKDKGVYSKTILVKNVVIQYPSLLETAKIDGVDTGAYSIQIEMTEEHPQARELENEIDRVAQEYANCSDKDLKDPRFRMKDGKIVIRAKKKADKGRVKVVDGQKRKLTDDEIAEVQSTSVCNVAIMFFGYTYMGKKGVGCALKGIQVLEAKQWEDDPFEVVEGVSMSSDDDWDDLPL